VTPDELHHLVSPLAGLTPKAFMQALTLDHAKGLLRDFRQRARRPLDPGFRARGGCTTCSSPTRRCRRANGRTAAPA